MTDRHPETGRYVQAVEQPSRAADSPANTGEQRGTAWPRTPGRTTEPVSVVVSPAAVHQAHPEAVWSQAPAPVQVLHIPLAAPIVQHRTDQDAAPLNAEESGR